MVTEGIEINTDWTSAKDTADVGTNPVKMADLILHDLRLAKDPTQSLYFYKSGVYVKDGETAVKEMYKKYMNAFGWRDRWNDRLEDRIIKFLKTEKAVPDLLDRPILNKINLLNGIYDLYEEEDKAFSYPSPDYLTTTQIPITYDPRSE